MNETSTPQRLSEAVHRIRECAEAGPVSLQRMIEIFGDRGHGFMVLFLTIPFLQPIPLVGLSTVIGLVIAVIGAYMTAGRPPRLPRRMASIRLPPETLLKICSGLEQALKKMERIVRPRGAFLISQQGLRIANGLAVVAHGLLLALPLPIPLSNFLPAVVLLLVSLGLLEQDGLVLLLGYIGALVNLVFFSALLIMPVLGLQWLQT